MKEKTHKNFIPKNWKIANSGGAVISQNKTIATLETAPLKTTPEIERNARLIAAAPELLEEINRLIDCTTINDMGIVKIEAQTHIDAIETAKKIIKKINQE